METIELVDLTKYFEIGQKPRAVFAHLNLTIPVGEITVIVGRSGCGKSTLLRILGGELKPDGGEVRRPSEFRSTMLYPEPYLITWTSVLNNIALASGVDYTPEARDEKARRIMELVQLSDYESLTPLQLSTGMKQRLGLARALASQAQLLLMDEPFASLDFCTRAELQQQLLNIQKTLPRTIVFVTHQLDEAILLARQIVVLRTDGSACAFDLRDPSWADRQALKEQIITECMK